jgi:hypothetical protein
MDHLIVEALAAEVVRRIAEAKEQLAARMKEEGCHPKDGWRIVEELRNTVEGTEWTFRPVHLRHASPDFCARVAIDHNGRPL